MELVIDGYSNIIDNNFKEFCSLNDGFDKKLMDDFMAVCRDEVLSNILTQFGLSRFFDEFKDGGNVATEYNAEKGIFPDEEIARRYNADYKETEKYYRNELSDKRKEYFQNNREIKSYATGEILPKDGRMHLDHVKSAKSIHEDADARLYMDDIQRGKMAQDDANLKPLESNINQSKGASDIKKWANKKRKNGQTNAEYFEVNEEEMLRSEEEANRFIRKTVNQQKYNIIGKEGIYQGLNMGKKQVMGLVIFEFTGVIFHFSKSLFKEWKIKKTISDKVESFKEVLLESIEVTKIKLKSLPGKMLDSFITGVGSGFLANFITFIINQFATTMSSMVKIINDSIHSIIRAFKIVITRPNGISSKVAIKEAIKIISTGIIVSGGIIFSEILSGYLKTTPLNPVADILGSIVGAILSGILSALILYSIDNLRDVIKNIGIKLGNTIKYAKVSAQELEQIYRKTLLEIDELYIGIIDNMYKEYSKLGSLREMAYDFNILSSVRFEASIEYARFLGVGEDDIIKNEVDLDNFFNN